MYCRSCGKELEGTPEVCNHCGAKPLAGTSFCSNCGAETSTLARICQKCGSSVASGAIGTSPRSRRNMALITFFLGWLGIHRFMLGKRGTAIIILIITLAGLVTAFSPYMSRLMIFFFAVVGVWVVVDLILVLKGKMTDKESRPVTKW